MKVGHEEIITLEEYKQYYSYTKPEIHKLRQRISVLEGVLKAYPKFPESCAHDEEPDYCDGCLLVHQTAIYQWKKIMDSALPSA